jgi:hypothetical protein
VSLRAAAPAEHALLLALNDQYLRAVERSDLAWFERHLGEDFRCSLPDGAFLDRAGFLDRTRAGSPLSAIEAHDILVRPLEPVALIHARTTFLNEGRPGRGRYTDVWAWREGRWVAIAAHVTRL